MTGLGFVSKLLPGNRRPKGTSARKPTRSRLELEPLEERSLLSANVLQTNLVSDLPGVARFTDPNLVNPWGISQGPGPLWISDNNSGLSTIYNGQGQQQNPLNPALPPLIVSIPTPGNPAGHTGTPNGTVFNPTILTGSAGFIISDGTHSGPAIFLFATEDGTIVGWNPGVDPTGKFDGPGGASTHAVIAVDNSGNNFTEPDPLKQTGAVYKGMSIATSASPIFAGDASSTTVLYAANFRSGKVEVYDPNFKLVTLPAGAFSDPKLPKNYAPFDVQVLDDKVYVSYAQQDAAKHDDVGGHGHGFVDVFNLLGPLTFEFRHNNKFRRVNACGVVRELLKHRPDISVAILPVVVDSLGLDDDPFNDSADNKACDLIAKIFVREPRVTDRLLHDRFEGQSQEIRCLTGDAYRLVLWADWDEKKGIERARFDEAIALAFRRCLDLVQDPRVDLEVRQEYADAVQAACRHHPDIAMPEFDTLLGTLACLYTQAEAPAAPPRIMLPTDPPPDPRMQRLEQLNRQMSWDHFKTKILECLEELAGDQPVAAADRLIGCFASLDSKKHETMKAAVVTLLGEVGRHRETLPRGLPFLWKALMDYESVSVRSRAIEAIRRCYESAECDPPPDIVEALLLHLKDSFVAVHCAAMRAIGWNTRWLTTAQAQDAIQQFAGWAATYRKSDPYKLRDIASAILSLSLSIPAIRFSAVRFIADLLPTSQRLVDAGLIELLTDRVDSKEEGAFRLALKAAAWLARDQRDLFDHRDDTRDQVYDWLRSLPKETFQEARAATVSASKTIAERGDGWSVYRFAAIFASFRDFAAEADVLGIAKRTLPQGRRYDQMIESLGSLESAANINEQMASATTREIRDS